MNSMWPEGKSTRDLSVGQLYSLLALSFSQVSITVLGAARPIGLEFVVPKMGLNASPLGFELRFQLLRQVSMGFHLPGINMAALAESGWANFALLLTCI